MKDEALADYVSRRDDPSILSPAASAQTINNNEKRPAMKTLTEQLSQYAAYHRDRRNILTHFFGIPLIVLAVAILLSRASIFGASPALIVSAVLCLYYLALDRLLGLAMCVFMAATLAIAAPISSLPRAEWLGWGIGLFVVGWVIQFVGHVFEGRKPAFVDDLIGLAIGPLFVVAEFGFILGLRHSLQAEIEARVGPVRDRRGATA
jgi:uncharacterized membrane protein YGL010W